jgi:hypothetical protein
MPLLRTGNATHSEWEAVLLSCPWLKMGRSWFWSQWYQSLCWGAFTAFLQLHVTSCAEIMELLEHLKEEHSEAVHTSDKYHSAAAHLKQQLQEVSLSPEIWHYWSKWVWALRFGITDRSESLHDAAHKWSMMIEGWKFLSDLVKWSSCHIWKE